MICQMEGEEGFIRPLFLEHCVTGPDLHEGRFWLIGYVLGRHVPSRHILMLTSYPAKYPVRARQNRRTLLNIEYGSPCYQRPVTQVCDGNHRAL
jgi:hypothetical protein